MNKKNDYIRIFFLVSFIVFLLLTVYQFYEYYRSDKLYEEAKETYYEEKKTTEENKDLSPKDYGEALDVNELLETEKKDLSKDLESQQKNNEEDNNGPIIGWIRIPGTPIDYPVVQANNNDFYLDHNYLGENDSKGAIFMDYRNSKFWEDDNYIIYGHRMIDGSMFSALKYYVRDGTKEEYFNEKDTIIFDNFNEESRWKIFSVYVVDLDNEYYYLYPEYDGNEKYLDFVNKAKNRSLMNKDIEINSEDEIMTLVTCSYWFDDARIIMHAVKE